MALDVDATESRGPERLEELELIRFRGQEHNVTVALLKHILPDVVDDELRRMLVTLEAKLLGDEAESHVWFVPI